MRIIIPLAFLLLFSSCSYMKMVAQKGDLRRAQRHTPSQVTERQLSPEKCTIVYGKLQWRDKDNRRIMVGAFSMKYGKVELVQSYEVSTRSYYSLYLPAGQYLFYAFEDRNSDGYMDSSECVGHHSENTFFTVGEPSKGRGIVGGVDIEIASKPQDVGFPLHFQCKSAPLGENAPSEYPEGSIRSLDDPLFSEDMAQLGLYYPSQFLEKAGIYFYAMQERDRRKIPVLFVHGIGGTPRNFKDIVAQLDCEKYDPWFFYYPSGEDLDKISDILYEIFFSGNIIDLQNRELVVVAHSMGGIVARTAINRYSEAPAKRFLKAFVTIATPYGGDDMAKLGVERAPEVVPSWRDVASGSSYIAGLYATPLPRHTDFHLFFAFRDDERKSAENSDETIALKSQLDSRIQGVTPFVYGFNETHTSILSSPELFDKLNTILSEVR